MAPQKYKEGKPFPGPLGGESMLYLKQRRHAGTSSKVGLSGSRAPIIDSLRQPVPVLSAPITFYLLLTCRDALRFRGKNGWVNVLHTARHFWML